MIDLNCSKLVRLNWRNSIRNFSKSVFGLITSVINNLYNKIIYNIFNLLYKLNIINKFNYRRNEEKEVRKAYSSRKVETKFISAKVLNKVLKNEYIYQEWFYFKDKNKPLYTVHDVYEVLTTISSSLDSLVFHIANNSYPEDNIPTFKYYFPGDKKLHTTSKIDVSKYHQLQLLNYFNVDPNSINEEEYLCYFDMAVQEFEKRFEFTNFRQFYLNEI